MHTVTADNLPRLMQCNGSRLMAAAFPIEQGDQTLREEGNAAHWLANVAFTGQHTIEELIDRKAPNGVYITPEMAEHVQWYLDCIAPTGNVEVETSFGTDQWRVNTRADYIFYNANELIVDEENTVLSQPGTLHIDDFKYGWSVVEVEKNWTLIAHAIGFITLNGVIPQQIVFTIHQPRPHHADGKRRQWVINYSELLELYSQIAAVMQNPSDMLQTGPQCAKCHALATCPAAQKAGMNAVDASEFAFNDDIGNDMLSFELLTLQSAKLRLENRLTALEELAKHRLRQGQIVDKFGVEIQLANTSWKEGVTADTIRAITGVDITEPKMITPNQAKKRGVNEDVISVFTERRQTGVKLIRADASKRAERIFSKKG